MSEFRRSWQLLLGSFIGIATGVSSLYFYSLGVFLKPVAAEFGWSRGAASLGPLVGTLGAAIAAAPTGRLMDRIGPVRTALVAMALLALSFAALGVMTKGLAAFLALSFFLSLITIGSTPLSYTRLIVGAFDRHRGIALGVTLAATGVGAALIPTLLSPYISVHGWRAGYMLLASVVVIAIPIVAVLLRQHGEPQIARPALLPLSTVIEQPAFQLLGIVFLLAAIGVLGTVVHFPALLSDAGLSPQHAGTIVGSIGVSVIVGRGIAGLLLDRVPAAYVAASFFAVSAGGLLLLAVGGVQFALPGALVLGLSAGAEIDLVAFLVSRLFQPSVYGTAYGGIYALFLLGGALGPAIMGTLFDLTGSYRLPLLVASLCLAAAATLSLRITRLLIHEAGFRG